MQAFSQTQLQGKLDFINRYANAQNAADGSGLDANANVTHKNIATLEAELMKDCFIQVNRTLMQHKISELFGQSLADEYVRQIEDHEIYVHDETSLKPYCTSIATYPFILDGLTKLGGESKAPKHIESFFGTFVNLAFAISLQFAGAIATVEFLTYFDYFARKDYGENYLQTHRNAIANHLQHVVYALNQSDNADSLASCCRLRSEMSDNTFSYTLGAGGVVTGSISVITLNMNRLIQQKRDLKTQIQKIQRYQVAYRVLMEEHLNNGLLSVYDANKAAKAEYGYLFNTEFVPAENLGVTIFASMCGSPSVTSVIILTRRR